jgi:hypothetical protein
VAPLNKLTIGRALPGFTGRGKPRPSVPVIPVTGPAGFSALVYQCKLNVDWDGAPKAYGLDRPDTPHQEFPLQKGLNPYEVPANNGSLQNARAVAGHWVGVFAATEREARAILRDNYPGFVKLKPDEQNSIFQQFLDTRESLRDLNGRFPVVQLEQLGGQARGYYVSTCNAHTGVTDNAWDQRRYVDASKVAYAALPNLPGVALGDCGIVIRTSKPNHNQTGFFFGDTGAGSHLGECSGAVKLSLAPERNGEEDDFAFIVFPGSGNGSTVGLDSDAVRKIIRHQFVKIKNTGDALAKLIAPHNPQRRYFVGTAIWLNGGPFTPGWMPPETRMNESYLAGTRWRDPS